MTSGCWPGSTGRASHPQGSEKGFELCAPLHRLPPLPGFVAQGQSTLPYWLQTSAIGLYLPQLSTTLGRGDVMELIEITADGSPARPIGELSDVAIDVMTGTAEMYKATGYQPPWIGYLAIHKGKCVGTCAYKTPPVDGRVEIAYFTFPGYEGGGIATSMARHLVEVALAESKDLRICAQTLPEQNASTRVLEKLGFQKMAEIEHPEDGKVWEWERRAQQDKNSGRSALRR